MKVSNHFEQLRNEELFDTNGGDFGITITIISIIVGGVALYQTHKNNVMQKGYDDGYHDRVREQQWNDFENHMNNSNAPALSL